ncbi:penicillin-binding protein activator [Shewanella sp. D64]|uniref:penicillin-binding protein activator n=1 Tax=unclassified Shewanella TaxID=196818 RepID=UPI0022BA1C9B|nr:MULTISPECIES: penicillin-binding protein activator [unclassified Shewanella]MEC4728493.1 penicillin-binding protein activator [Shewanella sp. D64]MEC4740475.1 penicillin-binding protein activator [Shewanella sp. E94]WBJ95141.1 penicillin-binding protein activator [Shewanella sp. MTB7]
MLKRLNTTKLISIGVLTTVLFGCGTTPAPEKLKPSQVSLVSASLQPADYLTQAANADSTEQRTRYLLLAAHAFINEGDASAATKTLKSVENDLGQNTELLAEHKYLKARVLELTSTYDDALRSLNYPSQWKLADWQMVAYYQFKARLYQAIKQPIEQARQLSLLSAYLPMAQAREVNDKIWRILQPMHEQTLLDFSKDTSTPIFAGWLQLAYIAKHYAINPSELVQHLGNWQHANPTHPGAVKLPTDLEKALNTKPYQPKNIAVLLPLSGSRASVASTVKQGIMSRYLSNPDSNVSINFFDTAKGAKRAYEEAMSAGAEFIIGPLFQSEVEQLQQPTLVAETTKPLNAAPITDIQRPASPESRYIPNQVPQLYLNHVDEFTPSEDTFYFALSPANEASDAADKLFADGIVNPLILASNNAIGRRMTDSFNKRWAELTKETAEVHFYDPGDKMKVTVQKSLGVIDSKERIARIKALLGNKIEADFRSRRDIDAIYMISGNHDLPLLKPFIDVNFSVFAEPVPLYASSRSRVEDSSRSTALELNNLNISDIPWLLIDSSETQLVKSLWPTWSYGQKRLYIMGYDALELVEKLAQMRALPGYQFSGRSGMLSVSPDGTVNRQLSWGRYQRGSLRPQ